MGMGWQCGRDVGVFFTAIMAAIVEDVLRSPLDVMPSNAISNTFTGTVRTPVAIARRNIGFFEPISTTDGLLGIHLSPYGGT